MCFDGRTPCSNCYYRCCCCSNIFWLINKANRINCHFSNYNIYIWNYRHACRQRARFIRFQHSTSPNAPIQYTRLCWDCVALRPIQFVHSIHTTMAAAAAVATASMHTAQHQRLLQKWRDPLDAQNWKWKRKKCQWNEQVFNYIYSI